MKDSFRSAWTARFPKDNPPELSCLEEDNNTSVAKAVHDTTISLSKTGIDKVAVEKSLQKCNDTIAKYSELLQKQQFIADFLWGILHDVTRDTQTRSVPKKTKSARHGDSIGRAVPGIVGEAALGSNLSRSLTTDGVVRKVNKSTEFYMSVDDAALDSIIPLPGTSSNTPSPTSPSRQHYSFYQNASEWQDFNPPSSGQCSASVYSTCSSSHPSGNWSPCSKKSLPELVCDDQPGDFRLDRTLSTNSEDVLYSDGSSDSLGIDVPVSSTAHRSQSKRSQKSSSSDKGSRLRPVPAPRVSRMKAQPLPGESCDVSHIESASICCSVEEVDAGSQSKGSPSLGHRVGNGLAAQTKLPEVNFIIDLQNKLISNVSQSPHVVVLKQTRQSPLVHQDSHTADNTAVTSLSEADQALDSALLGDNHDDVVRHMEKMEVYEEAALVQREFIEADDASSDDEEPLYSNLQKLKDQAMSRAQTLYASRDEVKAALSHNMAAETTDRTKNKILSRPAIDIPAGETKFLSSESVRSNSSDSALYDSQASSFGLRKRRSLLRAMHSTDSQSESEDHDMVDDSRALCPDEETLHLRKFVVRSILDSERSYLGILDILMQYMQTFKNCLKTPQIVIPLSDIQLIFNNIPDLHKVHKFFVRDLEPRVDNWTDKQQIADLFKLLAEEEYKLAPGYLQNYPKAIEAIHRCRVESEKFAKFSVEIQVPHMKEKPNLEELLHKPVVRFQRNTLVLHDLIKYTPSSHSDYDTLQKILQLAQSFLDNFEHVPNKDNSDNQRYLAKQGLIVEKVGSVRKLRHIFLFNDVIVCAKPKFSVKQKTGFEPKWYIPLKDLTLDDRVSLEEEKLLADYQQQELETLQKKVSELQNEFKTEMKQTKGNTGSEAQRNWSFHNRSRNIEKIRKKLIEQQAAMIKASPRLLFRIHNRKFNRSYTLLMASDYERSNWRFTIAGLLSRVHSSFNFSSTDLQNLLNSQKLPKVSMLESVIDIQDITLEVEHLFGVLNITIYKLQGLRQPAEAYCSVEVDSFSHFFMKAKTNMAPSSTEPTWNEDFEIDLEGAQTVRILCYKMGREVGSLIGTCALELSKAWLRGDFQEKSISLNDEISLTISLRYASRHQTLKRTPTCRKEGLFGAKIKNVTRRESTKVPRIVTACIQEVERRGLEEVGIYRVSGASGEIQKLKQAFEKNTSDGVELVKDVDINVVTGLLKLYFRELPEALFTDSLYPNLCTGMGLKDPDAKEKYIISLLQSLCEPNHSVVIAIMDHLIRVSRCTDDNKMTLQNLATVFGPTLLRPAVSQTQSQSIEELFSAGTREAMTQTSMLLYLLILRDKGAVF